MKYAREREKKGRWILGWGTKLEERWKHNVGNGAIVVMDGNMKGSERSDGKKWKRW